MPTTSRIGLVLSGGGAFGAWETGALHALFEWWKATNGEEPPIRAVVGTSTGALISPFALLGRPPDHDYLAEVIELYRTVTNARLRIERLELGSPAAIFLQYVPSVYDAGYRDDPAAAKYLYKLLRTMLSPDRIAKLGDLWNIGRRLGVATLDFGAGAPHLVTNAPADLKILLDGIFASAMAPLALAPVMLSNAAAGDGLSSRASLRGVKGRLRSQKAPRRRRGVPSRHRTLSPHMDGGLYEEMPIRTLFDLAAIDPPISLTHVVVASSFPWFPSDDSDPVQSGDFPKDPKFGSLGDRMNALMSEASSTKDTRLAWAAIELRKAGRPEDEVLEITGHRVADPPPELIRLFPKRRLGWQAFQFVPAKMKVMQKRGCQEAAAILGATVDCSGF